MITGIPKNEYSQRIYGIAENSWSLYGNHGAINNEILPDIKWDSATTATQITLSNNNLTATLNTGGAWYSTISDTPLNYKSNGIYYWELYLNQVTGGYLDVGIATKTHVTSNYIGSDVDDDAYGNIIYGALFDIWELNGLIQRIGSIGAPTAGVIIGMAVNLNLSSFFVHFNGTYANGGNPITDENFLPGTKRIDNLKTWYHAVSFYNAVGDSVTANFGHLPFSYNPF